MISAILGNYIGAAVVWVGNAVNGFRTRVGRWLDGIKSVIRAAGSGDLAQDVRSHTNAVVITILALITISVLVSVGNLVVTNVNNSSNSSFNLISQTQGILSSVGNLIAVAALVGVAALIIYVVSSKLGASFGGGP